MNADLLRSVGCSGPVLYALEAMGVAESVMVRAKAPAEAFKLLVPLGFVAYSLKLYRAHCEELVARVKAGQDTRPGTEAEVIMVLSKASLARPPGRTEAALYERLFRKVFPGKVTHGGQPQAPDEPIAREEYPGVCDELLATLRRKAARPDRRLT